MQTIKKYANRKLYHTNRKQYITLEGIATLIQAGEQVYVIDNESGDDITAAILAQVALQTHGDQGNIPTNVLTGLIRAGGDTLSGVQRSLWGALGGARLVDDAIRERLDQVFAAGMIDVAERDRLLSLLIPTDGTSVSPLPELPTRRDVDRLHEQVDQLAAVVEQLIARRQ